MSEVLRVTDLRRSFKQGDAVIHVLRGVDAGEADVQFAFVGVGEGVDDLIPFAHAERNFAELATGGADHPEG